MPDHVFAGWYSHETEGEFLGHPGDPYTPDGNVRIFARWQKAQLVSAPQSPQPSEPAQQEPEPDVEPEPEPERVFTVSGTGSLSLVFGPVDGVSSQYIWFCSPGVQATVCSSPNTTVSGTGLKIQKVDPMSYPNATGVFNVSVRAPQVLPAGYVIGPGAGITCTMRAGGTRIGTANGAVGGDWTGSGLMSVSEKTAYGLNDAVDIYWFNYWYTGCSFNEGVTEAEFYNEYRAATPN
jgi:hypothetical protein